MPRAPKADGCRRVTVTNYAKTHDVYTTFTGTMTILETQTSTVYSPTSGTPKPTRACSSMVVSIAHG
jgi:hypothetical protein